MAAPIQYYVDPSIAGDSGAGTVGDPYGDLEYCLEQITRNATNGDQINIKAGTSELLEFALDIAGDYGTPTGAAPIIFRGYTSAANDGGIGVIDGQASVSVYSDTSLNYVLFVDLRLRNTGSNHILSVNDLCSVINCELDTTSGIAIDGDNGLRVVNCYFHDCTGTFAVYSSGQKSFFYGNIVLSGVTTAGMELSTDGRIINNIVKLTTTNGADGIRWGDSSDVINNSVFATAGTGSGFVGKGAGIDGMAILNNIAEGFSGAGGDGYDFSATDHAYLWGYNAAYNNTNNENKATGEILVDIGGDDIPLDASAFTAPGSNDFSVGTEVKATAMPNFVGGGTTPGTTQYLDMGAAQRQEAGGGGGTPGNMMGGMQ
jgi:hypothetical protein